MKIEKALTIIDKANLEKRLKKIVSINEDANVKLDKERAQALLKGIGLLKKVGKAIAKLEAGKR